MQASREMQAEQNPEAHAHGLAQFLQQEQHPQLRHSNQERVEAARRLAALRSLTGNDELSRALHDLPDAIDLGNRAHQQGLNFPVDISDGKASSRNAADVKSEKGLMAGSKGLSLSVNRFLRLN